LVHVSICDLTGKTISSNNYINTNSVYAVPVNTLAHGVYFIKVDTGAQNYPQKIIIGN